MLSAQLQIEQAEATLKAAKWAYIPSLALAPQGTLAGVDWGKATQTYTIPATASWQLDLFGSLHNAKKRAKAQLANSEAFRQAVQSQLIAAIANYYYSLAMLGDQLAISMETEKLWKENVKTTRALMEAGQSNMAAVSQTEANYYSICTQITDLKQQISDLENEFCALLGDAPQKYDIGTMEQPVVFTENQSGGINPHKNLTYEQSAQVVIGHVTNGLKLAEKYNLPKVIKDFITTHHGCGVTKYFYISWKNEHPGEETDPTVFTYPGPNPFTKEQAILMMADAVEAASRSLPEYTAESIGKLVDKIVDSQVAEGFFKECPITFKDIAVVKNVFKEKLKTMYHTRISYPELKK